MQEGGGIVIWHLRQMQTQRHGIFVRTRNTTRLLNFIVSLNIVITSLDKQTWYSSFSLWFVCPRSINLFASPIVCVWCDINCGVWRVGYCVLRTPTRVPCHTIPPGLITSTKCKIKSDHDLSEETHCDNIYHAPAGTRRPVQDRPISSSINIPTIMKMSPH